MNAGAADWPQFRGDAARSAATAEELPATLHLAWIRNLPAPRPAFPAEIRLQYDASYEPIVLGKTLFLPSMVTDSVTALDTETGQPRWQFFAEGPVRLAPVAWHDNLYFVSDDGHLYCLDASDGRLRWKSHGLPPGQKDRKILGGGRLISLRPARGGPVLYDGVLYFAAGLWSKYGVGVYALDPKTGKTIWSNTDCNHIERANMDHGIGNFAGLSPHGYMAVVNRMLVVPCGEQLPAFLDLKSGTLAAYSMGWGGRNGLPKGTWFVAGSGKYLSHGGDLYDIGRPNDGGFQDPERPDVKSMFSQPASKAMLYPGGFTRLWIEPANQKDLGSFHMPVFDGNVMYDSREKAIVAHDLSQVALRERSTIEVSPARRADPYPDRWLGEFPVLWQWPSSCSVHIKAGKHLYLGDKKSVEAVRIPTAGQKPETAWRTEIEGTPHRMVAADGKLFVVTREGRLYAFSSRATPSPMVHQEPCTPARTADRWTATAGEILQASKVADGYALVLGLDSGRLVEELVRQSKLDVIAIDRDPLKVERLRRHLNEAGLYGTRVSIHVGDPLSYPLPPYLASLVVSEDWSALWEAAGKALPATVFHSLRPYGGTACMAVSSAQRADLTGDHVFGRPQGAVLRTSGRWLLLSHDGPLPGAADWSHAEADAANTGASAEKFVQAPLDLLWFDGPPRWRKPPGATLVRICGGRMLIKAEKLQAVDIFTGRRLWESPLPFPHQPADQFVAVADAIYVTGGADCLVLDPATGGQSGRLDLPTGLTEAWANVRVVGGNLIAQSGKYLFCMDRHTGRAVWQQTCRQAKFSVVVGAGKVFCAQFANKRQGESQRDDARTQAFELATGRLLWEITGASDLRYCPDLDLLVLGDKLYRANDGSLLRALHEPPQPTMIGKRKIVPRPLFIVGQKLLYGSEESFVVYDLRTGYQIGEPLTWVRRGCTLPRASANFVVTRYRGNAACIDLATREIIPFWNVRTACSNSLFPADGVLNMPSLTGGCTCNYLPVSQAYVPAGVIDRVAAGP